MTKPEPPRDGNTGDALGAHRLQRLAAFAPKLRNLPQGFARAMTGEGTAAAPYRPGGSSMADLEIEFSLMAYDAGWVIPDFDWVDWIGREEGVRFMREPPALGGASEDDLAKFLTALVRQERFADGTLQDALAHGLLLAAAEQAEVLLGAPDNSKDQHRS